MKFGDVPISGPSGPPAPIFTRETLVGVRFATPTLRPTPILRLRFVRRALTRAAWAMTPLPVGNRGEQHDLMRRIG